MSQVKEFNAYREQMNEKLLGHGNKNLNRFFNLDTNTYKDGALDLKTKELLGLVASMVLRCDDCIKYHIGTCHEIGVTKDEIDDVIHGYQFGRRVYMYSTYKKSFGILGGS